MRYQKSNDGAFPLVYVNLAMGEEIRIESGAMVYHNGQVELQGKMNSNGAGGVGGALKALGRSMTSGESFFQTTARGVTNNGYIALAPRGSGQIRELQIGQTQWCLNDGAFLACDPSVTYQMVRQSLGHAIFSGTGGLFVMHTQGTGQMLVSAYGDIQEIVLNGTVPLVVDNTHVVAWESTLNYQLEVASGMFGFTTGEGLVNRFQGVGRILIQTRSALSVYQPSSK